MEDKKIGYDFPKIEGEKLNDYWQKKFHLWRVAFKDSIEVLDKKQQNPDTIAHNCAFEVISREFKKMREPEKLKLGETKIYVNLYTKEKFDHFSGRVMTMIEALGLNSTQEKAFKDIIKQEIWHLWDYPWGTEDKITGSATCSDDIEVEI